NCRSLIFQLTRRVAPPKRKQMKKIQVAGVPEHFNLPWQLCIENRHFEIHDLDVKWTNVPEGTGRLCQMLRDGEADVAVILTEGFIKDLVAGNPSKIVQVYVESPLIWGIHVGAGSPYNALSELDGTKAAISRIGSGSQLMAYVNAANQNWHHKPEFEIVHTIDGAVEALTKGTADYFMWERFMTKPLVDSGVFRRLADCRTPWPSFVIAVTDSCLQSDVVRVYEMLDVISKKTAHFKRIWNID